MIKRILIFVEQEKGNIHPVAFELIGKAHELIRDVNEKSDYAVDCVVLGNQNVRVDSLIGYGVDKIHFISGDCFEVPDEVVYKEELVKLIKRVNPEIFLIGATSFGRSIAPRIAAALKTGLTADCTELRIDTDESLVQIRPAFSGNILAHIKCERRPQMATVRYKEFARAQNNFEKKTEICKIISDIDKNRLVYTELKQNEIDITEYDIIVAGGKGLKNPDDFNLLRALANKLNGQIGATRAVVEEGYISKEYQVGYSGHRVKPKLYIACGISGAPQHIAGMKDSKIVFAINSDPSAPIFNIADYGIVGDLYEVIPRLMEIF